MGGEYAKLSGRTGKHPLVDNTPGNQALVDRLARLGDVSSRTTSGSKIKVNMRKQ